MTTQSPLRCWPQLGLLLACILLPLSVYASDLVVEDAEPGLRTWEAPDLPADLKAEKIKTKVVVDFIVDEHGEVASADIQKSPDPRLDPFALAAVRQWSFVPGIRDGKSAPYSMRVAVVFDPDSDPLTVNPPILPKARGYNQAKLIRRASVAESPIVSRRLLGGEAVFDFVVNAEGKPEQIRVLQANCPEFIAPSLRALQESEFDPAHQGSLNVPAHLTVPFEFSIFGEDRKDVLRANGIKLASGEDWTGFSMLPFPITFCDPIYPRNAVLNGLEGAATVQFTVTPGGTIENVIIGEATDLEFGQALAAAILHWHFAPAQDADRAKIPVRLAMTHKFVTPTGSDPIRRLANLLGADGPGIAAARGLDAPLRPVFRISAVPPESLKGDPAEAKVEFIIDRDGQCRLPRVLSATNNDFGWAAATAVRQWVFEPPLRGGEPTAVRVIVPFSFTP